MVLSTTCSYSCAAVDESLADSTSASRGPSDVVELVDESSQWRGIFRCVKYLRCAVRVSSVESVDGRRERRHV